MTGSILIVNWNSRDYLRQCLATVRATCEELRPQIVVVDGGSFDGCGEMLAKHYPEVEFVQSQENIGFGRSNNLGFQRVRSDALLLLNPDTELQPAALSLLLQELERLPDAGIVGPQILNSDGSLQTSCVRAFPTPLNQALDSDLLRRLFPRSSLWGTWRAFASSSPVPVECLSGACMLLRTETFNRVGGFSPEFFMYGEDVDLCFKVSRLGLKQYYVPTARVVHHGGKSSGQQFRKFPVVLTRVADQRVIAKWQGTGAAVRYRWLLGMSAVCRLLLLLPALALAHPTVRGCRRDSLLKWLAILSWALGRETWTRPYEVGGGVSPGSAGPHPDTGGMCISACSVKE